MSFQTPCRVKESTNSSGTGALTLIADSNSSLRTFAQQFGAGPIKVPYMISGIGYYEQGIGTFTSPATLTRDKVIASSNSGNLVSLPSGVSDVFCWWPGGLLVDAFTGNKPQALADWDNVQCFTGSSPSTYSLLALTSFPAGFTQLLRNAGTANWTIAPNGSDDIDGVNASINLLPGESGLLIFQASTWRLERLTTANQLGVFVSSDEAIPSDDGVITLAHGLGDVPTEFAFFWVCQSAEAGYSTGDVIPISANGSAFFASESFSVTADATNITIQFATTSSVPRRLDFSNGNLFSTSTGPSVIKLRVMAWP